METTKQQAYLLKDQTIQYFIWVAADYRPSVACPGHAILYEGDFQNLKLSHVQPNTDNNTGCSKYSAIEQVLTQPMGPSCVEMHVKYDKVNKQFKMSTTVLLGDSFVKSLLNLLTKPKISLHGTFWNSTYPFKIAGMELKAVNRVDHFEGTVSILQILNTHTNYTHFPITYSIILEWEDLKMTVTQERSAVLEKLFSKKLFTDCCNIAAQETEVRCHKGVLAANSDVIHAMLTSGMEESQNNIIPMTDISEEVVNLLLAYLYGRDINTSEMSEDVAFELLRTAHKYNISSLQELMAVTFFNKPNDSFSMNCVLDVYFFTMNVEELTALCDKMLHILKSNPRKLLASTVYQDLLEKSPKEANKLALKLLELVTGEPTPKALPEI